MKLGDVMWHGGEGVAPTVMPRLTHWSTLPQKRTHAGDHPISEVEVVGPRLWHRPHVVDAAVNGTATPLSELTAEEPPCHESEC